MEAWGLENQGLGRKEAGGPEHQGCVRDEPASVCPRARLDGRRHGLASGLTCMQPVCFGIRAGLMEAYMLWHQGWGDGSLHALASGLG